MSSCWSGHVVRRKGGHVAVVCVLDVSPLAGAQAAHAICDEALAALAERPALVELVRSAPQRGDYRMPT